MIKFNINNNVRVRLTDAGRQYHRENYEVLIKHHGAKWYEYKPPKEDTDGWSTWQLWSLMNQFGAHLSLGAEPPFIEIEIDDD